MVNEKQHSQEHAHNRDKYTHKHTQRDKETEVSKYELDVLLHILKLLELTF